MEWLLAGDKLQRCRTVFLDGLPAVRHALLLGEGNGRFLGEFLLKQPNARVTCVDASAAMLDQARQRADGHGRVTFVCRDVTKWTSPQREFDLVVSNFFLDCFRADQIEQITAKVSNALTDNASWLIADFCEPRHGWRKWRARFILKAMYGFFRRATDLPAKQLTAPDAILARYGFKMRTRHTFEWGLLQSDLWVRRRAATHVVEEPIPGAGEAVCAINSR